MQHTFIFALALVCAVTLSDVGCRAAARPPCESRNLEDMKPAVRAAYSRTFPGDRSTLRFGPSVVFNQGLWSIELFAEFESSSTRLYAIVDCHDRVECSVP